MPKFIEVMPRRSGASGDARWNFERLAVNVDEKEIIRGAVEYVEDYVRQRLDMAPKEWRGLAKWLQARIRVVAGEYVSYPTSEAVERMRRDAEVGLTPKLIDEAIESYLKKAFEER